jgi:hypothetical protein
MIMLPQTLVTGRGKGDLAALGDMEIFSGASLTGTQAPSKSPPLACPNSHFNVANRILSEALKGYRVQTKSSLNFLGTSTSTQRSVTMRLQ